MADIFDVIADSTRRELLHVLLQAYVADSGGGEVSVGGIVERVELTQPTVSKHLKVLRDHGLVSVREEGQHRFYKLDAAPLETVEDWLIPFLSADFDSADLDAEGSAFAAWAGADLAEGIGRKVAEGTHQARTVIHDASEKVRSLPKIFRRLPFRNR